MKINVLPLHKLIKTSSKLKLFGWAVYHQIKNEPLNRELNSRATFVLIWLKLFYYFFKKKKGFTIYIAYEVLMW